MDHSIKNDRNYSRPDDQIVDENKMPKVKSIDELTRGLITGRRIACDKLRRYVLTE